MTSVGRRWIKIGIGILVMSTVTHTHTCGKVCAVSHQTGSPVTDESEAYFTPLLEMAPETLALYLRKWH